MKKGVKLTTLALAVFSGLFFFAPAEANAEQNMLMQSANQTKKVTGQVFDELGEPMIGVTVAVKGTTNATVTDFDGNFSLSIPGANATLELRYIGYKTATVQASPAKKAVVKMELDNTGLEEIVVIGYGTVKKRDLTGAVTTVKADEIRATPLPNPVEALQGKVAGLDITRSSGAAGAGASMQLRGNRSLSASGEPLVLIDGLAGSLTTLNANDIESIEVLKDAASTAVYGSAGANGIIIVTTKSGKEGKTKVNFNSYVGINGWSTVPEMYDAKGIFDLRKQSKIAAGTYTTDEEVFNPDVYAAYMRGESIDWADELLKTGITQNYSLSVSGGTEKTKAYLSLNFSGEEGQYDNDNYRVYSSNIKVDHKVNKMVNIGVNMQGSYTYKNSAYAKLETMLIANPIGSLYDEEGNINPFPIAGDQSVVNLLTNNRQTYRNNNHNFNVYLNPYIRINPMKGLTFESRLSLALSYSKANRFNGIGSYNYWRADALADGVTTSGEASASVANTFGYNYKWENILTYNFTVAEDHEFTLTGVSTWNHNRQEYSYSSSDNLTANEYLWHNLGTGQNQQAGSSYTMSKGIGFVGRVNYSYLGKYLASVSVRHDASSRLAEGNRWDTFPAFSLGWRISEEKFMEGTREWLDNLKLRGGWGVTGTASISAYQTQANLAQSYRILGNQTLVSYNYPQQIVDPNLGWEKSYNTNIGIDAGFFGGRLNVTADYYFTKTKDIIWTKLVPVTNGGFNSSSQYTTTTNICESENNGLELAITGRPFVAKKEGDFSWTVDATFTYGKEKLTSFSADDGSTQYINGNRILKEGEPINSFYGYKLDGTWKTSEAEEAKIFGAQPGDIKINCADIQRHVNADGSVYYTGFDPEGNEVTYDINNPYDDQQAQQVLGHPQPDWTMGLKNSFTWKNFDFSVYLYWRYGQMINYSMLGRFNTSASNNFPTYFDYWTEETGDQNHRYPALNAAKDLNQMDGWSGLTFVDGSFWKVKNVTIGYTLPKNVLKKIGAESIRVYGTITNPFVFAKSDLLKDYDPEMAGNLDYPLTKQMVFGVNVTF